MLLHLLVAIVVSCPKIFTSDMIMISNLCKISEITGCCVLLDLMGPVAFVAEIAVFCMIVIGFLFFCHNQRFRIEEVFHAFGFNFDKVLKELLGEHLPKEGGILKLFLKGLNWSTEGEDD